MIPVYARESAALFFGPVVRSDFTRLRDEFTAAIAEARVDAPQSLQPDNLDRVVALVHNCVSGGEE